MIEQIFAISLFVVVIAVVIFLFIGAVFAAPNMYEALDRWERNQRELEKIGRVQRKLHCEQERVEYGDHPLDLDGSGSPVEGFYPEEGD